MTTRQDSPLLELSGISKSFAGVQALRQVNLRLGAGEVLALIGENGAGKSTLMKILGGVQAPDAGEIRVAGQSVAFGSCRDAMDHGIALIHQELNLADNLDIAANLFLGREPRRWGLIDRAACERQAMTFLQMVGLDESPRRLVGELSIGKQQMVEIAKALSINARILIMDEPTSSLSAHETQRLMQVVHDLRRRGVSVIYISHRLGEVQALADRVTVLRDGQNAGELRGEEIGHDAMVRLMVGRDLSQVFARTPHPPRDVVLSVDQLRTPAWPQHPLSFQLRAGEIVGIAGLVGAGRTELLQVLFGITPAVAGTITLNSQRVTIDHPRRAIELGMALVPEDRKQQGIVLDMSIRENVGLPGLRRHQRWGFFDRRREQQDTETTLRQLRVRAAGPRQYARYLSGGNQQKVVIGKWLALQPRVLLLDEPTRGIDVGAKQEIYTLIESLAREGLAILFVSSEMEEILGLSDRVLVMHEGRITGTLSRDALSEEAIMQLATGDRGVETCRV